MKEYQLPTTCPYEGTPVICMGYKCLPIYTSVWLERIQGFLAQDHKEGRLYQLKPELTDSAPVLESFSGYLFVIKRARQGHHVWIRDMGGVFPVNADFLSNLIPVATP